MRYDPHADPGELPPRLRRATDKTGWHVDESISILDILNLSPDEFRHELQRARDLQESKLALAKTHMRKAMRCLEEAETLNQLQKTLFDMATDREEGLRGPGGSS